MTPRQIQIELRERNIKQKELAQEFGVSEGFISLLIRKKTISRHIMEKLSAKIGADIREVFPEYFDPEIESGKAA